MLSANWCVRALLRTVLTLQISDYGAWTKGLNFLKFKTMSLYGVNSAIPSPLQNVLTFGGFVLRFVWRGGTGTANFRRGRKGRKLTLLEKVQHSSLCWTDDSQSLCLLCKMGIIISLHRLLQRINKEIYVKSLNQCLVHSEQYQLILLLEAILENFHQFYNLFISTTIQIMYYQSHITYEKTEGDFHSPKSRKGKLFLKCRSSQ